MLSEKDQENAERDCHAIHNAVHNIMGISSRFHFNGRRLSLSIFLDTITDNLYVVERELKEEYDIRKRS